MVRFCLFLATASIALADGFAINIGGAVASGDFRVKGAVFVFRSVGCADPLQAQFTGTAEGIVEGSRKSMPLKIVNTSQPNVYGLYQNWPATGDWMVHVKGTCGDANAAALVPMGPKGFIRESSKFLQRPAKPDEIEAVLKGAKQ